MRRGKITSGKIWISRVNGERIGKVQDFNYIVVRLEYDEVIDNDTNMRMNTKISFHNLKVFLANKKPVNPHSWLL